jgi:hypothetical protein
MAHQGGENGWCSYKFGWGEKFVIPPSGVFLTPGLGSESAAKILPGGPSDFAGEVRFAKNFGEIFDSSDLAAERGNVRVSVRKTISLFGGRN